MTDYVTIVLVVAAIVGAFSGVTVFMGWIRKRPRLRIHDVRLSLEPDPRINSITQLWITFNVRNGFKRARWLFSYATDITARISIYDRDNGQKLEQLSSGVLCGQTLYPGEGTELRQGLMMKPTASLYDVSIVLECRETGPGRLHRFKDIPMSRL